MTAAVILAVALVLGTTLFHFSVLRWLSRTVPVVLPEYPSHHYRLVLLIVFGVLATHMVEIMLYAAAYYVTVVHLELGAFRGVAVERFLDYLYFSSVTYTSLGLGDVFPSDHVRIIAGIEALNGLLLIAWSGSFIFIAMGRLWPWDRCSPGQITICPIKASGPKD